MTREYFHNKTQGQTKAIANGRFCFILFGEIPVSVNKSQIFSIDKKEMLYAGFTIGEKYFYLTSIKK